uniref:hypothetical protein n=1 Tax=Herbidospora sakaeratensis TaxID=564415 RepID=UPI000784FB2C|nr:hypothetical protein [Herbidospora sakaeratensis]
MDANLRATYQEEGLSGASFQADAIAITGGGSADFATGGLIQVFSDENAAAGHAREVAATQPPEHAYQVGNVLLRISKGLPEADARRYRTALEEIVRQG